MQDPWGQTGYDVRFEWGPTGASQISEREGVLVVVDVLSFTTSVSVAVERGTAVYPAAWRDARAADLAREVDAVLAVGRREVTAEHPWSLSPAALRAAPAPSRLVLPSPNGSAIAAAAAPGGTVVAVCLRNARAVATWIAGRSVAPVIVVAAGERWPDGSLRPALEDLLGAGAVIAALVQSGAVAASPEAIAARAVFEATASVPDAVRRCGSGVELITTGYAADVDIAVELDASDVVPVLGGGAFPVSYGFLLTCRPERTDAYVRAFTGRGLAAARVGAIDRTGLITLVVGDQSQVVADLTATPVTGLVSNVQSAHMPPPSNPLWRQHGV